MSRTQPSESHKMAEASERVPFDAIYCDLTIEEENDPKVMDADWDIDSENIETSVKSKIIHLLNSSEFCWRFEMEVCKTKHENGIQTLEPLPTSLLHYPLGHPAAPL
ncbi:hypothetical protein Y032_0696g1608 [Ancylostoma ceylanicum]|uniref:Uncharacterized protein n=1 Tax=Ancylostoma ceylanicum TaxID=53326 RepID=A0A016WG13_9BILA|nr:hypothetical protein Y032_0696g1608 [Ancylostoma ceylanicum]